MIKGKRAVVTFVSVVSAVVVFCVAMLAGDVNLCGSGGWRLSGSAVEAASVTASEVASDIAIVAVNDFYNQYIDYPHGYSIYYPRHMQVDTNLSAVRTVMTDQDTQIELYYDNFNGTIHTADRYISFSNKFKHNSRDHQVEKDEQIRAGGLSAHLLQWSREKITNIGHDKNYYLKVCIIKNQREVYTVFIKSAQPIQDYMPLIDSFSLVEKRGAARNSAVFRNTEKTFDEETGRLYRSYFLESRVLKWGIYEWSAAQDFGYLNRLEKRLGYKFEFIVRYQNFGDPFPAAELQNAYLNDKCVELTLQTGGSDPGITYAILRGEYDGFLNRYARDMKSFGKPVLFRLNNEMNGDWCIYSSYFSSNDTELFKALWQYVYGIFRENGVDNALWVWNPHDVSFPGFKWNHYLTYYPGDEYVDIVGLTGYNTGTHFSGESWRGFREIYDPLYGEYNALFKKPLMITEFGASSIGGDKILWIMEMFVHMEKYANIKVAIWWNGIDYDPQGNPGRIYRLDETEEMLDMFRRGLNGNISAADFSAAAKASAEAAAAAAALAAESAADSGSASSSASWTPGLRDIRVLLRGEEVVFTDAKPFIDEQSRVLVPLRVIAESMGLTVTWGEVTGATGMAGSAGLAGVSRTPGAGSVGGVSGASDAGSVTIQDRTGSMSIVLRAGDNVVTVNGAAIETDTKALLRDGRYYIPLRLVAELMQAEVEWESLTRTVLIKSF